MSVWKEVRDKNGTCLELREMTALELRALPESWRFKLVNGFQVALSQEEMAERDAEETQWRNDEPKRMLQAIEEASGMDRGERDIAIQLLPATSERRKRAEAAEAAIALLGVRENA